MNFRLVCKLLGLVAVLIGVTMIFSLPWAFPSLGWRHDLIQTDSTGFEKAGFFALVGSILASGVVGALLIGIGRKSTGNLYHREAMAVVGLAWLMATVLGALPFYLSGTQSGPSIRLGDSQAHVYLYIPDWLRIARWQPKYQLSYNKHQAIVRIVDAGPRGISAEDAQDGSGKLLHELADGDADFRHVLRFPGDPGFKDREDRYRVLWTKMSFIDAMFESQSGFSTTGATVISELEDPQLVPRCILFWRSSTHFLGGLGIIVLFVAILGQGSAGKALMRNEVPGPSQEGSQARMQQTAWVFASIYFGLNALLALLLKLRGMSWLDALCHAFGTMATGGFSTYNDSIEHFHDPWIDGIIILFMLLAGMNFTLLYFLFLGKPGRILKDFEWRAYIGIIVGATLGVVCLGYVLGDFTDLHGQPSWTASVRYGLFQVVSIMTTTGYSTHDFDGWNNLGRCLLMLLMFVGGCAGSTGGGVKVIRVVLLVKILGLELERAHHPRVVRPLRIGGKAVEDNDLRKNILVYLAVIALLFVVSWLFVVGVEPDTAWAGQDQHKLIDSASAVAATLNNIGPGLGTVGPAKNYAHFSGLTKLLFTWLMMLGRVEVFAILVLFMPSYWRSR